MVGVRCYLCNVGGNNGRLGESVKDVNQPSRKVFATVLGQIEASHTSQPDTQGLEEYCEKIRHEDDEEMRKSGRGASCGRKLAVRFCFL